MVGNPHFFTVIFNPHTQLHKLSVPKRFVRDHGNHALSSSKIYLRVAEDSTKVWPVTILRSKVEKNGGRVFFGEGWPEFARHYSVSAGYFITFRYEGHSHFHVVIYGPTATQIDYQQQQHRHSRRRGCHQTNTDADAAGGGGERRRNHVVDESPPPLSLGYARIKEEAEEDDEIEKETANNDDHHLGDGDEQKVEDDSHDGEEEMEDEDHSQMPTKVKRERKKIPQTRSTRHPAGKGIRASTAAASNDGEAMARLRAFKTKYPHFTIYMCPTYVANKSSVHVPTSHSRTYLPRGNVKSCTITLSLSSSSTDGAAAGSKKRSNYWRVSYHISRPYSVKLSVGWYEFVLDNHLQVGDICNFELVNVKRKAYKVSIIRGARGMANEVGRRNVDEYNSKGREDEEEAEVEDDKDSSKDDAYSAETDEDPPQRSRCIKKARSKIPASTTRCNIHSGKGRRTITSVEKEIHQSNDLNGYIKPKLAVKADYDDNDHSSAETDETAAPPRCFKKARSETSASTTQHIKHSDITDYYAKFLLGKRRTTASMKRKRGDKSTGLNRLIKPNHAVQADNSRERVLRRAMAFKSRNPHFLIQVKPSLFTRKHNMYIWRSASIRFSLYGKGKVFLQGVEGGKAWPVKYIEDRTKRVWLNSGLKNFVEDNKLRVGDVCVFELIDCDTMLFTVNIFRIHDEQVATVRGPKARKVDNVDGNNKDKESEEVKDDKDGYNDDDGYYSAETDEDYPPTKSSCFKKARSERQASTTWCCSKHSGYGIRAITDAEMEDRQSTGLNRLIKSKRPFKAENDWERVLRKGMAFKPRNAYFLSQMHLSGVTRNYIMYIRSSDSRRFSMHVKGKIFLRVEEGRKRWPVKCLAEKTKNNKNKRVWLTSGWKNFVVDNKLRVGDVCVFELIVSDTMLFNVHIFRMNDDKQVAAPLAPIVVSNSPPRRSLKRPKVENHQGQGRTPSTQSRRQMNFTAKNASSTARHEAAQKAKSFQSENPYFIVQMCRSYILPNHYLHIPQSHALRYINKLKTKGDGDNVVILRGTKGTKSWSVQYWIDLRCNMTRFSVGWDSFVKDNGLKIGDFCAFELVDVKAKLYKVTIYR